MYATSVSYTVGIPICFYYTDKTVLHLRSITRNGKMNVPDCRNEDQLDTEQCNQDDRSEEGAASKRSKDDLHSGRSSYLFFL